MCTVPCGDLTSAPEGNTSCCFRPLITIMDFLLMDVQRINSERANSQLPSPTPSALIAVQGVGRGEGEKKIIYIYIKKKEQGALSYTNISFNDWAASLGLVTNCGRSRKKCCPKPIKKLMRRKMTPPLLPPSLLKEGQRARVQLERKDEIKERGKLQLWGKTLNIILNCASTSLNE